MLSRAFGLHELSMIKTSVVFFHHEIADGVLAMKTLMGFAMKLLFMGPGIMKYLF